MLFWAFVFKEVIQKTPHLQGVVAVWAQEGWEELPNVQGAAAAQVQEGREELLHLQGQEGQLWRDTFVQGKEQQLCFAGAAVKRYPTSKVRETQVRQ